MAPYMRVMLEAPLVAGVSVKEAFPNSPLNEVGYEALHNAGHRRSELKNWKCGVFCGDSGPILTER